VASKPVSIPRQNDHCWKLLPWLIMDFEYLTIRAGERRPAGQVTPGALDGELTSRSTEAMALAIKTAQSPLHLPPRYGLRFAKAIQSL
jgi:hypothetical protein